MIQIEEQKVAEMMFDIWHNSDDLKNPIAVGEYIANKLKAAISDTRCCCKLKDKEVMTFDEWFSVHGYYYDNSMWLKNSSINGLPNVLDKYNEYKKRNL